MFQRICLFILGLTLLAAAGCRSCYAPYDNCQPTFVPERGDCCMGELYRTGSVFVNENNRIDHSAECKTCGMTGSREDYIPSSAVKIPQNLQTSTSINISKKDPSVKNSPIWSLSGNEMHSQNAASEFELGPIEKSNNEVLPEELNRVSSNQ